MESKKFIVLSAGQEWNYFSWSGVFNDKDIKFIKTLFPRILNKIWWIDAFRYRLFCDIFWIPYIKYKLKISKYPTTLFIYDWGALTVGPYCIKQIRDNFPNLKLVYIFTNIIKISGAKTYRLLPNLKTTYDVICAFDPLDAKRYGFEYSKLIYTLTANNERLDGAIYDIFYVGQAKDRHDKLIQIYKNAVSQGLKCRFYITGVPENEQYKNEDIIYNQPIKYAKVIDFMKKSKCIVDAIQGESAGLTIKTCEAVLLNKKLITTNTNLQKESFYRKSNILIYTGIEDLKAFLNLDFVPYSNKDRFEFSPYRLFKQIENT